MFINIDLNKIVHIEYYPYFTHRFFILLPINYPQITHKNFLIKNLAEEMKCKVKTIRIKKEIYNETTD